VAGVLAIGESNRFPTLSSAGGRIGKSHSFKEFRHPRTNCLWRRSSIGRVFKLLEGCPRRSPGGGVRDRRTGDCLLGTWGDEEILDVAFIGKAPDQGIRSPRF